MGTSKATVPERAAGVKGRQDKLKLVPGVPASVDALFF
jgi:hypothetical protein